MSRLKSLRSLSESKESGDGDRYVSPKYRQTSPADQNHNGLRNSRLQFIKKEHKGSDSARVVQSDGTGVYRHPYSRGDGKSIPGNKLRDYIPPSPLDADKSQEWNKGDIIPNGGPLPFDNSNPGHVIKAVRKFGSGSLDDPMVLFSNNEVVDLEADNPKELKAYISFAKDAARSLGFTCFWIRKKSHYVETKRNRVTGSRIGGVRASQNHITVLLGNATDWVNVHGHIFVVPGANDDLVYMPQAQMMLDASTGARRRVVELWKWDEKGRVKTQNRNREIFEKERW